MEHFLYKSKVKDDCGFKDPLDASITYQAKDMVG